jgi:hypothetical protein
MVFHLPFKLVAWGAGRLCRSRTIAGGVGNPSRVPISTPCRAWTLARAGSAHAAHENASSRAGAATAGQRRKCERGNARRLWSDLMAPLPIHQLRNPYRLCVQRHRHTTRTKRRLSAGTSVAVYSAPWHSEPLGSSWSLGPMDTNFSSSAPHSCSSLAAAKGSRSRGPRTRILSRSRIPVRTLIRRLAVQEM